jgi:membrane-associated two-gene conflict system component 1 (EACC1)
VVAAVVCGQEVAMDEQVELRLEPLSGRFDTTDERWLDQVDGLVGELRAEADEVSIRRTTAPGTKGAVDAIVIPLISAGGLTAVIEMVRSWLNRDRTRSLKVSWSDSGSVESLELSGADVEAARFDDLLQAVMRTLPPGP